MDDQEKRDYENKLRKIKAEWEKDIQGEPTDNSIAWFLTIGLLVSILLAFLC